MPVADTVMDMSANCYVPVQGLTSSEFPTSQMRTKVFSRGQHMKTGVIFSFIQAKMSSATDILSET